MPFQTNSSSLAVDDLFTLLAVFLRIVDCFLCYLNVYSKKMKESSIEEGNSQKPQRKHPSFGRNLWEYFSHYSDNTSIHGVRYLGEKKRSIIERLIWLVILTISLYLCLSLIVETYEKWKASPVIVSFAKSPTPVWQIPFPAVTICPQTKIRQRLFNYTDIYHKYQENPENMTDAELKEFEQASLVCDNHLNAGNKTIGFDTILYLAEIAPKFEDTLYQCKWINENQTCYTLLTPILTEEGVCYTLNMLNRDELFTNLVFHNGDFLQHGNTAEDWSLETGYKEDAGVHTFPRRAISAGQKACFSVLMFLSDEDADYVCKGPIQGFKILIHSPVEMPRVSQNYFWAPPNQEVVVAITPDMMTTSEGLRDYNPEIRQCYFLNEKQLKYFQIYTQRNCEVECLTNYSLSMCDCVAYHMPHDEATEICGAASHQCILDAQAAMLAAETTVDIELYESENYVNKKGKCHCLPSCTSVSYNAESSQAEFEWEKVVTAYGSNVSEFYKMRMTRMTIFFKEQQFITSERNELYGPVDFLANCGGLLGLFIGFSFLSVIEILYFLTLRFYSNRTKY